MSTFSLVVSSWNLGHKQPQNDLNEWIPLNHDLYCIGLQECDFKPREQFKTFDEEWLYIINSHLGKNYKTIAQIMHSHVMISVHVKESFVEKIKNAQVTFHHITDTKGGVAVGVWLQDISLCFICAHLAAHQFALQDRNSHMNDIEKGISFSGKSIYDFDQIFIGGDLNYRVVGIPWDDALKLINEQQYNKMLETDQLKKELAAKNILIDFNEGPITFPPTFKLHTNNIGVYSPTTGDPIGVAFPSWCDRILWKNNTTKSSITQNIYTSIPTITQSDHRPVLAIFTIKQQ